MLWFMFRVDDWDDVVVEEQKSRTAGSPPPRMWGSGERKWESGESSTSTSPSFFLPGQNNYHVQQKMFVWKVASSAGDTCCVVAHSVQGQQQNSRLGTILIFLLRRTTHPR